MALAVSVSVFTLSSWPVHVMPVRSFCVTEVLSCHWNDDLLRTSMTTEARYLRAGVFRALMDTQDCNIPSGPACLNNLITTALSVLSADIRGETEFKETVLGVTEVYGQAPLRLEATYSRTKWALQSMVRSFWLRMFRERCYCASNETSLFLHTVSER